MHAHKISCMHVENADHNMTCLMTRHKKHSLTKWPQRPVIISLQNVPYCMSLYKMLALSEL